VQLITLLLKKEFDFLVNLEIGDELGVLWNNEQELKKKAPQMQRVLMV
jgi:hypothetical protein